MRIGVNARLLFNKNMEGIPRYIFETTTTMALTNPDNLFFLFYDRYHRDKLSFPANVIEVTVPLSSRHPVLWYLWFELLLPLYLWKYKIDVFYSGDGYMSLNTKVPTIMVMHDLAYLHYPEYISKSIQKYYQKNVPKFLTASFSIITVSEFVKKDIIFHFDIAEEKIHVVYNAVRNNGYQFNDDRINQNVLNVATGTPYFIYVGSLHPRKNIARLIQAFNQFNENQESKYKLVLAGRMAWKTNEIKNEIQKSDAIIYLGMVTDEEKEILIKKAIALVYVSVFEGFGIPILEAMQMGTPVITSSVSSMPEVAGGAALLTDPENTEAISDSLQLMADDVSFRKGLIIKGKKRAIDFNWQDSSKKIYSLLADAAKKELLLSQL